MSKKQTVPKRHTNQCKQCGRSFKTNHPESATCSRTCRTLYFKRFVEDDDIFTSLESSSRSYILGLIAADGCVYLDKASGRRYRDKIYLGVSITSGSKEFLEELSLILKWNLGISARVHKDSRHNHSAYYLRIGKSRDIAQFRDFIYSGQSVQLGLLLDRKRAVFKLADDVL